MDTSTKSAFYYGYRYAQEIELSGNSINLVETNSVQPIARKDVDEMLEAGVKPDARAYWMGFNEAARSILAVRNRDASRVIFEENGQIVVQLPGWAHKYKEPEQAANIVAKWIKAPSTNGWKDHEDEALYIEPDHDDLFDGRRRSWTIDLGNLAAPFEGKHPVRAWNTVTAGFFLSLEMQI